MRIEGFRLTRFQYARDRVIGDSQVASPIAHYVALELLADRPVKRASDSPSACFHPLPAWQEIERVFLEEAWPSLEGQPPAGLIHRVARPRGGNAGA